MSDIHIPAMRIAIVGFAIGLGLCFVTGCGKRETSASAPPTPAPKAAARLPRPHHFQTHWQDESQYIVESIVADLTEMILFSAGDGPAALRKISVDAYEMGPSDQPTYEVVIVPGDRPALTCQLKFDRPIWAPESYQPVAHALAVLTGLVASNASKAENSSLLQELTSPTAQTLAAADVLLSKRLAEDFRNPGLHEQAALLLGAFAMREPNGIFYQGRSELCRITTHLAFAQELRGTEPLNSEGLVAKAALTALYNNQASALEQATALPDSDVLSIWKRALRLRATNDFRIIGEARSPRLLETREWFRARAISINVTRAWHSLRLSDDERQMADWTRIALNHRASVGLGHELLRTDLAAELREFSAVVPIEGGPAVTKETLVDLLNREPLRCISVNDGGAVEIQVIGLGRWAALAQRSICGAITSDFVFMNKRWGVPEEAVKYRERIDPVFSGLRLYPFVKHHLATENGYYHKAQDEAMALVRKTPHVVPSEAWNDICYRVSFGPTYIPPPHAFINEWHKLNPPPGTAYDPYPRLDHPSLTRKPDTIARLEQLHRLAPYDSDIAYSLLEIRDGEKPSVETLMSVYGPVLDYDPSPNRKIARIHENNPAEFERWMGKAVALDPADLEDLADWYVKMKREDEAAHTYLQWIANEIDPLRISANTEWLVEYFERHGQIADAAAVADRAADSYSGAGLLTKAKHLTRMEQYDAALDVYLAYQERYNNAEGLVNFLMKIPPAKLTVRCKQTLDSSLKEFFPDGLRKLVVGGHAARPKRGVRVQGENDLIKKAGLQKEDIIVIARGYEVQNWRAFKILRAMDDKPYVLTVWRNGDYVTLKPLPHDYRFGFDLETYAAESPTGTKS